MRPPREGALRRRRPNSRKLVTMPQALTRIDGEPGSVRLQVAPAHNAFDVAPGRQRRCGPAVEFIAIRADHETELRMAAPGQN